MAHASFPSPSFRPPLLLLLLSTATPPNPSPHRPARVNPRPDDPDATRVELRPRARAVGASPAPDSRAAHARRRRQSPLSELPPSTWVDGSLTEAHTSLHLATLFPLPSLRPFAARLARLHLRARDNDRPTTTRRRPAHLAGRNAALCASAHPLGRGDLPPRRLAAVVDCLAPVLIAVGNERHDRGRGGPSCFRSRRTEGKERRVTRVGLSRPGSVGEVETPPFPPLPSVVLTDPRASWPSARLFPPPPGPRGVPAGRLPPNLHRRHVQGWPLRRRPQARLGPLFDCLARARRAVRPSLCPLPGDRSWPVDRKLRRRGPGCAGASWPTSSGSVARGRSEMPARARAQQDARR